MLYQQAENFAVFNKPVYAPGDTVEGIAVLTLMGHMPNSVRLSVEGRDNCEIRRTDPMKLDRSFMKSDEIQLQVGRHILKPGTYQVPFSFKIPTGVPDSFKFDKNHGAAKSQIEYRVCISLHFGEGEDSRIETSWSAFEVRNRIPSADRIAKPVVNAPVHHDIYKCCCFKTGAISAELSIDKSAYFPGETVKFRAVIKQSKIGKIRGLKAEFGSVVHASQPHPLSETLIFCEDVDHKEIATPPITFDPNTLETVVEFEVTIPEDADSSSMGIFARRCHFIRVHADTPSTFITDFGICVLVLPKSDADLSVTYPQSLMDRVKERVPVELMALPKLEWKLPANIHVESIPRGSMEEFIVPIL